MGNLPHTATEEDLREIFSQFGNIVDLRIHNKPGNKVGAQGSRAPPNYGFITYETQQEVQNCLSHKPIYFPHNDKNGTLLNIEEKRAKERSGYGSGTGGVRSTDIPGRPRDNGQRRGISGSSNNRLGSAAGGGGGGSSGTGNRPNNNFSRGPQNRGPNNTYSNRR